jgi:rod shape-determining protein MreD
MRTFTALAIAAACGVLLQTTLLPLLPFGGTAPDLLLVLCVYLGLFHHTVGGAVGAFLLGYLQDGVSGGAPGLNAFALSFVFLFVYLTSRRLWVDNLLSKIVLVFLASVIKTVTVLSLLAAFRAFEGDWGRAIGAGVVQAVVSAAIAPPMFALLASLRLREDGKSGA